MQSLYVMDLLLMTASILAITLMVWVDRVRFGTCLTPTAILGIPYMGIALMAFLTGPVQGYVPLYTPSVVIWMLFLGLFWATGQAVAAVFPDWTLHVSPPLDEDRQLPLALAIAWMAIPVLVYGTLSAAEAAGGFGGFRDSEYRDVVASGLVGHALMAILPVFIFLLGTTRRRNWVLSGGTCAVLFVLMVLRPTKSWVLLPLVAGLVCRARIGRLHLSLRTVVVIVVGMYVLFNVSYMIAFGSGNADALTDPEVYADLFQHVENYMFAGVLAFSGEMQSGSAFPVDPPAVYASLMNILSVVSNDELVTGITQKYTQIRSGTGGFSSNVHTLFGTLILSLGYYEAVLYTVVLALLSHAAFLGSLWSSDVWITVMWCFLSACLAFGWFGTYFSQLPVFEVSLLCVVYFAVGRILTTPPKAATASRRLDEYGNSQQ